MIFAVIDTNVFVSAYMTHNMDSATSKVVEHFLNGSIKLLYNEEIMAEYEDVLSRPHMHISSIECETLFAYIRENGILSERVDFNDLFIDEDDRVFYEIMLSQDDSFLVTGNLKHFPLTPRVVTPAQMLEILEKEETI